MRKFHSHEQQERECDQPPSGQPAAVEPAGAAAKRQEPRAVPACRADAAGERPEIRQRNEQPTGNAGQVIDHSNGPHGPRGGPVRVDRDGKSVHPSRRLIPVVSFVKKMVRRERKVQEVLGRPLARLPGGFRNPRVIARAAPIKNKMVTN